MTKDETTAAVAQNGWALRYASTELKGLSISTKIGSRNTCARYFEGIVQTGCFLGTVSAFLDAVANTHGDNKHAKSYRLWCAQLTTAAT